jgi:hypothetical protein
MTIKKFNNMIENHSKFKIDDESFKLIQKIRDLEKQHQEIKEELNELKQKELKRINKEFLINDYKRRFNVSQETVISAIIGEDNAANELIKQMRDQKVMNQDKIELL